MDNEVYFMADNMCRGVEQCCNLRRLFFRDMVDDTSIYGSAVVYAVYFSVTWSMTRAYMEVL